MQRAVNRFWDWLFHPSVRMYENKNLKASVYRYPSPANAKKQQLAEQWHEDYKTPYEHSRYNVRYTNPTPAQTAEKITTLHVDSLSLTLVKKLKKTGLLKDGDENNVDLLAEAKKKYLQKFGKPAEQTVYRNDEDYPLPKSTSREELATLFQSIHEDMRTNKRTSYDYSMDRQTIDDPEVMPLQSVDMFVSPHLQQTRILNEYLIERDIDQNLKKKSIDAYVGDARFWKAIDDSFPASQIEKVQKHVGDPQPTNFGLRNSKVDLELDSNGNVVDVHPKH